MGLLDKISEYVSNKFRSPVRDLFYLFTSTVIAIFVGIIIAHSQANDEYLIIIYILLTLVIVCTSIYVLLYHKSVNIDVVNKLVSYNIPTIHVIKKTKTITIGKDFFNENKRKECKVPCSKCGESELCNCDRCAVKIDVELNNPTTECYPKYRIGIESDSFVPHLNKINVKIIGHSSVGNHSLPKTQYKMWLHKPFVNGKEVDKPTGVECEFYIPLNLASESSTTFSISYPTEAFPDLLNENVEFTSMEVMQKTDLIVLAVKLDKSLRNNCKLSYLKNKIENNCRVSYIIRDSSKQRMRKYEEELRKYNKIPVFKSKNIEWAVPNPMIGCSYSLYFTVEKKKKKEFFN